MDRHPCVAALEPGCRSLNIPTSAARELVRFLLVKRFTQDERSSELGPSAKLDKLWHWLLLETDLRDAGQLETAVPAGR